MHKLLNPANSMAVGQSAYESIVKMMTGKPVSRHELEQAGVHAREIILAQMQERHRNFLLGIAQGSPDWNLVGVKNVQNLPAIKWKLVNVGKMDAQKRKEQIEALRAILENA